MDLTIVLILQSLMQSLVLAIVLESPLRREHLRLQVLTYKHLFPFLRHLHILVVSMQTEHEIIFKVLLKLYPILKK